MIEDVTPIGQGSLAGRFDAAHGAGADINSAAATNGDDGESLSGLDLDADRYLPMLADYDLNEGQAREMLTALWSIMRGFVEMGIRRDVCGELGFAAVPVLSNDPVSIDSKDHPS